MGLAMVSGRRSRGWDVSSEKVEPLPHPTQLPPTWWYMPASQWFLDSGRVKPGCLHSVMSGKVALSPIRLIWI